MKAFDICFIDADSLIYRKNEWFKVDLATAVNCIEAQDEII